MSGPGAPPSAGPSRGAGLGPPPSLDGLSALINEGNAKPNHRPASSSNGSMSNPPKPFPRYEYSGNGSANGNYSRAAPAQNSSQPGSPSTSTASTRNSAASMSRAPLSSQRFSTSNAERRGSAGSISAKKSSSALIDNLRKQAKTYLDPSYSVKSYVGAASALLEKARSSDLQGQAEQAFVNYLKAADVATQLPKHADWPKVAEERGVTYSRYMDFMKNVPDIIQRGHRLEELLRAREEARAKEAEQAAQEQRATGTVNPEQEAAGAEVGIDAVTDQQAAEETFATPFDSLTERLGALRMSGDASRDHRNASTSHLERRIEEQGRSESYTSQAHAGLSESRRGSIGTPRRLASPQLEKSGFAGISDGMFMGTDVPPTSDFNKSYPTLDDFEARQSRPASPSRPLPVPPTAGPSASANAAPRVPYRPPLPPPVKRDISVEDLFPMLFPGFETIVDASGQRLVRKSAPKLLLLDVRPRSEFDQGHIKCENVVCIEPSKLSAGMTGDDMAEAMSTSMSAAEKTLFQARNAFDIVVICDGPGRGAMGAVEVVYRAISMDARPAYLLGGVERWTRKVGEQGVARTPTSAPSLVPEGQTGRAVQNGDQRAKRQAMYGTPASLVPGSPAGKNRNGSFPASSSFDMLDSPSMPARTYQTAGSGAYATSNLTRQPALSSLNTGPLTPSAGGTFDYPQLNGAQAARPSYTNGGLAMAGAPTPPAPAVARTPNYEAPQPTYDIPRRPTFVAPPGGAPAAPVNTRQYSRFVPRVETNVRVGLTGLKNVGNSCYLNSVLQGLSATIPLSRFMLDGSYKRAINRVNPLGTQGALAEAFAQLIRVMWSEQYTFVSPVTFREAITRFAPSFRGYDQHDAQEFLSYLLDGLHEDLNYIKQKPPPVEMTPERENELETLPQQIASVKEWAIYRERNDSLIVDWFQGQFRNKLTCLTCGKTSTTYNSFLYLSLPIPTVARGRSVTLTDCLDAFTKEEVLEKGDAWHCSNCNKPRRATKKLTISRLPQVLLIHLKRFTFRGHTNKIETKVTFPTSNLDLTSYMPVPLPPGSVPKGLPVSQSQNPPYRYRLYAVTNHLGPQIQSGHYTASTRRSGDEWAYCDDSKITRIDESQVNSPSNYILWFHRQ